MANIQVILTEALQGVGKIGDQIAVKAGFARNYLLPRSKAMVATKANIEAFAKQKADLQAKSDAAKAQAEKQAAKFTDLTVTLQRPASETGQLYGSVKAKDLANALNAQKLQIEASQILIGQPIKDVGQHNIRVVLHPEVILSVTITIDRLSL